MDFEDADFEDADFEDDSNRDFPEGITRERVQTLLNDLSEKASHLGLYSTLQIEVQVIENDALLANVIFRIGKLAFAPRVQNPEEAKFADSFRQIEVGLIKDEKDNIINRYRKRKPDER